MLRDKIDINVCVFNLFKCWKRNRRSILAWAIQLKKKSSMSYIVKEVIAQRDGSCKPYNRMSHDVVTWDVDCDVSTAHTLPFVSRQSNAIGGFRSLLFRWVLVFREVWLQVVPSAVCCLIGLALCFLFFSIHASRISIPLSCWHYQGEVVCRWLPWLFSSWVSTNKLYFVTRRAVAACWRAQKRWRSGYWLNVYLSRVLSSSLAWVFPFHQYRFCRIYRESCKPCCPV